MNILRLFVAVVFGIVGGIAAGIVFVVACAASVGDGSVPGAPEWVVQLADLFWVPPLLGGVLGVVVGIMLARRNRDGGA